MQSVPKANRESEAMYDEQKVADGGLALMHLVSWNDHGATRS